MSSPLNKNRIETLFLTVKGDVVPTFFPLLALGFTIKTLVGCSVEEMLFNQLGLDTDYFEHRLQTIFLDGKAVDNVKAAKVRQGATLALSAAMPGLAGAILRRNGVYAAMRHEITHENNMTKETVKEGTVTLKLFNLVAGDLGPRFLKQGIWIKGKYLQRFFRNTTDRFRAGCRTAEINGRPLEIEALLNLDWSRQEIFFKILPLKPPWD